jgi:Galactose oxidase, central domain
MSVARVGHAALLLADGKVLVSGGVSAGEGAGLGLSRSLELWDPASRSFRRLANGMLEPRANHSMSLLPDGRVLIVGGYSNTAQPLFAEVFDPRTEQFSALVNTQAARAEHAAFALPDGQVLIVGGERPLAGQDDWAPTASVLRFSPASGQFTELPPLAAPRTLVKGALLPSGELLLFGGRHVQSQNSFGAERYNPASGGRAIARLDVERAHHTVTRLPSGRVAVIGGESRGGDFASSVRIYE